MATHELQKTNPASASSGFWILPPQPAQPESSCSPERTSPFQALMPEPRTAQKAKVQVQLAAEGSPHGAGRQIMVEGVRWVKNKHHKRWNKAPGHTLRWNSCNSESQFSKYLLSSQKASRKNQKKRKQFSKEKDERMKILGWKISTKFMSVMWNELVPTPRSNSPSHFQR